MRKYLLAIISLVIGIGGAWFVYRSIHFSDIIGSFATSRLLYLIPYFIASFSVILPITLRWQYILKCQKIKVPFFSLMLYKFMANSLSFITPSAKMGGEFIRALFLKRHNVPIKKGLSTVFIDKSLELSFNAIFFIVGFFIVMFFFSFQTETIHLFIIVSAIFAALLFLFFYHAYVKKSIFRKIYHDWRLYKFAFFKKLEKRIEEFDLLIIDFFHKSKKDFFIAMAISAFGWIFSFIEYKLALYIVGIDASLIQIFIIYSFVGLAYLIPIPMALGSLEGSQLSAFKILRLPSYIGVALSLLIRVRDSLFAMVGLLMLGSYGFRFKGILKRSYNKNVKLSV